MANIPARPTVYKGIQMRSRLEADFAQRFLETMCDDIGTWEYEPQCFGSADGQYLPDFRINWPGALRDYYEVKPAPVWLEKTYDEVDAVLERMEIIWASEPQASLYLVLWEYGVGSISRLIYTISSRSLWLTSAFPVTSLTAPSIWYGRGQHKALLNARRTTC